MNLRTLNKRLLLFIYVVFVVLTIATPVFAVEIKYPNLPGMPDLNSGTPSVANYISYFFTLVIYLGGLISLVSFTIGAGTFIASANNAFLKKEAKSKMKSAVLGLIMLMTSFLILKTINLKFVNPLVLEQLPPVDGVYLSNGSELVSVSSSVADTSSLDPNYGRLIYKCNSSSAAILIWKFPEPNLENGNNLNNVEVVRRTCGQEESISNTGSFKFSIEEPGVYYCLGNCFGDMCTGYMSYANTLSQDNISSLFAGKVSSVWFVNNFSSGPSYGIVYHEKGGLKNGSKCEQKMSEGKYSCRKITHPDFTFAADIFLTKEGASDSVPGNGIVFYSEPFGWNPGSNAGFYNLDKSSKKTDEMPYQYTNINRPASYKNSCKNFKDCPGSIKLNDKYLLLLQSENDYCQTFTSDIPNLKVLPIVADKNESINQISVLPIE